MKRTLLLVVVIVVAAAPAYAQTFDDPQIIDESPTPTASRSPTATRSPRATSTPDPDDTPTPSPTLDPDDVAMHLPGLPPLPDPGTLETQANVRGPRTPRSAGDRAESSRPRAARSDPELPATGRDVVMWGSGGILLSTIGALLLVAFWTIKRRRTRPVAAVLGPDEPTPPWGTDTLIGW